MHIEDREALIRYCHKKDRCNDCPLLDKKGINCIMDFKDPDEEDINEAYNKIAEEVEGSSESKVYEEEPLPAFNAWDLIKNLSNEDYIKFKNFTSCDSLNELMDFYSSAEIIEKYDEFRKRLEVGDEVIYMEELGVVVKNDPDSPKITIITKNGTKLWVDKFRVKSTGKVVDWFI